MFEACGIIAAMLKLLKLKIEWPCGRIFPCDVACHIDKLQSSHTVVCKKIGWLAKYMSFERKLFDSSFVLRFWRITTWNMSHNLTRNILINWTRMFDVIVNGKPFISSFQSRRMSMENRIFPVFIVGGCLWKTLFFQFSKKKG